MLLNPLSQAKALLIHQEAIRLKPYYDSRGNLTIGVGRCLTTKGISEEEAMHMLANDIVSTYRELAEKIFWFNHCDDVRQLALVSMAFNLGVEGLLEFKTMLTALHDRRWEDAAKAAMDSAWAREVGVRAQEVADMFKTGLMQLQLQLPLTP
jgi:lysozyme